MKIINHKLEGVIEFQPRVFEDDRGWFVEKFKENVISDYLNVSFPQDNLSFSKKGVIRGLHYQHPPYAQGKLVSVIKGKAIDVLVDIRKSSPTFGQALQVLLDDKLQNLLYVPVGFAHGFETLEETYFYYKCTDYYDQESEAGIVWNDPKLEIDWKSDSPSVSEKDQVLPTLANADIRFL